MNKLIEMLSEGARPVIVNRKQPTVTQLKERIRMKHVPVLFQETCTEIGIWLDERKCYLVAGDLEGEKGMLHLEGVVTLNYEKIRCLIDLDVSTLHGSGRIERVSDSEYQHILGSKAPVGLVG